MVKISECTRENFCVDCDDPDCIHAGDIEARSPVEAFKHLMARLEEAMHAGEMVDEEVTE